ncbi:hypothetical protein [Sphingomonas faeni]|uniref:hypothetical protein n=1 Tax=Sphingomonas faeni TaxID=185950 RepID=UPI003364E570
MQQDEITAFQLDDRTTWRNVFGQSNPEAEAQHAVAESGIRQILPENLDPAAADALTINECENGALADVGNVRVDPPANAFTVEKIYCAPNHDLPPPSIWTLTASTSGVE